MLHFATLMVVAAATAKYNPDKIVEVSDTLRFYKSDLQNSTYVAEFSLTPFRYIS